MKVQLETAARCRKKSSPSGRLNPQANIRQQHSASARTVPVVWPQDPFTIAQVQLCHGHHQYRFLVDGKPMLDPHATGVTRDEQGEQVSLVAVS